eukprot:1784381-Rhodomonas_salina.1
MPLPILSDDDDDDDDDDDGDDDDDDAAPHPQVQSRQVLAAADGDDEGGDGDDDSDDDDDDAACGPELAYGTRCAVLSECMVRDARYRTSVRYAMRGTELVYRAVLSEWIVRYWASGSCGTERVDRAVLSECM